MAFQYISHFQNNIYTSYACCTPNKKNEGNYKNVKKIRIWRLTVLKMP